jgi:hypothetical protein
MEKEETVWAAWGGSGDVARKGKSDHVKVLGYPLKLLWIWSAVAMLNDSYRKDRTWFESFSLVNHPAN